YNVLDSLINKGLVRTVPEKTKKFVPANPELFLQIIEKKEEELRKAKNEVKEMKKFYDVKDKNPVIVGEGRKAFYKIIDEMKRPAKEYNYSIRWTSEYKDDWVKSFKKNGKKTDVKDLVRYDDETKSNVKKWLKIKKNMKRFDNEG